MDNRQPPEAPKAPKSKTRTLVRFNNQVEEREPSISYNTLFSRESVDLDPEKERELREELKKIGNAPKSRMCNIL